MSLPYTSPIQKTPAAPQKPCQNAPGTCLAAATTPSDQVSINRAEHTSDAEPVDRVSLGDILDPVLERGHHIGVLGIHIHEREFVVAEPTLRRVRK